MSIWETQFDKDLTYAHDGSEFEWFAEDIVKDIDDTAAEKVHDLLGVLLAESRERKNRQSG